MFKWVRDVDWWMLTKLGLFFIPWLVFLTVLMLAPLYIHSQEEAKAKGSAVVSILLPTAQDTLQSYTLQFWAGPPDTVLFVKADSTGHWHPGKDWSMYTITVVRSGPTQLHYTVTDRSRLLAPYRFYK
jgi:hypothetical protein